MTEQTYDERLREILVAVACEYGEGFTSAEIAERLALPPRDAATKLRSLAYQNVLETSADWERPARYWIRWPVLYALKLTGAVA